jgi:hypothetical protein
MIEHVSARYSYQKKDHVFRLDLHPRDSFLVAAFIANPGSNANFRGFSVHEESDSQSFDFVYNPRP